MLKAQKKLEQAETELSEKNEALKSVEAQLEIEMKKKEVSQYTITK